MLIKNRTDIYVPKEFIRQFEVPDGLCGSDLAKAIMEKIGETWSFLDLTGADLTEAVLPGAGLTCADLTKATLRGARLTGAVLFDAKLTCADLTKATLSCAYLNGAHLAGAKLNGARLTCAKLTEAVLSRADLTGAVLAGARLTCAELTEADLTDVDLDGAENIATAKHERIIKIDFPKEHNWEIGVFVSYCGKKDILAIGCKSFSIEEWENMSDEEISALHQRAWWFWKENKEAVLDAAKIAIAEFRSKGV